MIQRDKLYKLYCRKKNLRDKQIAHDNFKAVRNQVVHKIETSKKNYFEKFFVNNVSNTKKIWEGIRSLVTLKGFYNQNPKVIKEKSTNVTDPHKIANAFNNFFVKCGPNIANKIKNSKYNYKHFLGDKVLNSVFVDAVREDEIFKILNSFDSKKSTGPNSFPIKILKDFSNILAKPLASIINLSFSQGIFPSSLKLAKVTPIYKNKGDTTSCNNYRPISLLSIFSKLFEKCIYKRLYSYLEKNNLIYEKQFGFRKGYSTNHALISLIETIKSYLDKDNLVCGVFIDLQKAFDTVDHDILLYKIYHYGIRGEAYNWIKGFLTNRKQYVNISGFESSKQSITCGVPQGSTLGPLLFLLYINDLNRAFSKCVVHHFADDTNLIFASKKKETIETVMNHELKILVEWLKANKLSLNESKTELIIFHSQYKRIPDISIKINSFKLVKKKLCKLFRYFDRRSTFME